MTSAYDENAIQPLTEEEMSALGDRLELLPSEHIDWVIQLFLECRRARAAEARLAADAAIASGGEGDITQVVLDTAEWLQTLWEVGYMGSSEFPTPPRTRFPTISSEDIANSALLARIRHGKAPLPFPPPTRQGVPWHEVVEATSAFPVNAEVAEGDEGHWINIEGCTEWHLVREEEPGQRYRVQHRAKGPHYHLTLAKDGNATLQRCLPELTRRIVSQSRGGVIAYILEWPTDDGGLQRIPLRAASRERAEEQARRWVAHHHPALYGQIHFQLDES